MPCWNTEFFLVLQMMRSAHCTTTIDTRRQCDRCSPGSSCQHRSTPVHRSPPGHSQPVNPRPSSDPEVCLAKSHFHT